MKSYSLKWRLVTTISIVFIFLWSLVFYWLYVDLEKRLQNTLDQRLSASAQMVAHLIQQLPVNEIIDTLNSTQQKHDSQNLLVCEVSFLNSSSSADPQVIVKTQGSPKLSTRHVGFSTWQENNMEWRSYVLQKGHIQVVTAEKLQLRYSLLKQILQSVLIPLIITLILCILLILWIVRVEFQPLDQIAQRVRQRKQHFSNATTELLELKAQNVPQEIQPFVDSLVELVQNLHQSLENEKSFSAFAAHELRSPLTAIKTHVQLTVQDQACGLKWLELLVKYDQNTCSWKTHQCLFPEDLPESSVILPKWGMTQNGHVFSASNFGVTSLLILHYQ